MMDEEMGQGEIMRGFARLERQLETVQTTLNNVVGPVGVLRITVENTSKDVDKLGEKVRVVEKALNTIELRAAAVTGGIMAIIFIVKFLLGK